MAIKFSRATERFKVFGLDLNSPVDAVRPGFVPIVENLRSYTSGVLEPRQGLSVISTVSSTNKTPVHSVRRLNDPNTGNWIRVAGVQDTVSFMASTSTANTFTRLQYSASDVTVSGNPLALIPYRPGQSPSSWMYLADSLLMRKVVGYNSQSITRGTVHQIGVTPPANPPTVRLDDITHSKLVSTDALGSAPNDWEVDGVVFERATNPTVLDRHTDPTTITRVVHDSLSLDWASVVLPEAFMRAAGVGETLLLNEGISSDECLVLGVLPGSATTTIAGIVYDNAPTNTGVCIITPNNPVRELKQHAVVELDSGGAEVTWAQVIEVIAGPDDGLSFKVDTGLQSPGVGDSLVVHPCVRLDDNVSLVSGSSTVSDTGAVSVTGVATGGTSIGWVQITPASPVDLTKFSLPTYESGTSSTDQDYMHVSLRFSDLSKLSQARLMFDCDTTVLTILSTANNGSGVIRVTTTTNHELADGDTVFIKDHNASTNGTWVVTRVGATTLDLNGSAFVANAGNVGSVRPQFKKNFYYRAISPNDLVPASTAESTAATARIDEIRRKQLTFQRDPLSKTFNQDSGPDPFPGGIDLSGIPRLDSPDTPDSQTGIGEFVWSEIIFRRIDLTSVGELASKGRYHSINAVRVEFALADPPATVWADIHSFTQFGGYAPDISELDIPYRYRYRYRVSSTGARSNWSPASRAVASPRRSKVLVVVEAPSGAPEVDKIDIQRLGGTNTNWLDIGTTTTSSLTFTDKFSDEYALGSATFAEDDTNFKPWPTVAVPFSTTATTVSGSYLITSAALPTSLAKGTPIKVDGIHTTFRRTVNAGQLIYEVEDSLGTLTNATVEIPAPVKYGQPLRTMWTHAERLYAVGDAVNPGTLYYSNRLDPDGTSESNTLELTPTSEPLQNGATFNGRNYVWSSERMFELQDIGEFVVGLEIPGGKGLFSPWGLAVGERMWFLSKDGIYQTTGGACESITDLNLKPFFVKEGNVGITVNGFAPPDFSVTSKLRLSYYDGYLYFIYQDTVGTLRCLTYCVRGEQPGWWPDVYTGAAGVSCLYGEEGDGVHSLLAGGNNATTAKLYQVSGTVDDATAISCHMRAQSFDASDRRAMKHFGDFIVDADSQGATINAAIYINNASTTALITPTVLSTSTSGRTQTIIDTTSGIGFEARNAALDLSWSSSTLIPKLYLWEPSFITLPETSKLRATYWDDMAHDGDKFFQGIEITTDTDNVARTVLVEYDGGDGVGVLADTLIIQHAGNIQKAYAFNPAFIAHQVRLRPTDAGEWKNFSYKWVWEREAPLGNRWETQQTTHGHSGFMHLKAMYVSLMSTVAVTLTVTRTEDAVANTYTIPTTTGLRRRVYVPLVATKGKSFQYTFTSTGPGFRLYQSNTSVLVKPWASNEQFASRTPFGAPHGDGKAEI